jgi:hypothetical protein
MATKACSVKNKQHGFIMTGQTDGWNMHFPVFNTILSTCRQNPKKEEYENIEKNMTNILYHSSEYDHISEDVYNQMGIVRDRDSMGCEVLRDATISQESYQRTKCLTHEHQIHLRKKRLALNQSIERQRKELATQKHYDKITRDDDIVRSSASEQRTGFPAIKSMRKMGMCPPCTLQEFYEGDPKLPRPTHFMRGTADKTGATMRTPTES